MENFKGDGTILGLLVRDLAGNELFTWRRSGNVAGAITRSAVSPIRASVQTMPGIISPKTVGEIEVEIRSLEASPDSAGRAPVTIPSNAARFARHC